MITTFVIIFTILAVFRVIVKEVLSQGFFPQILKRHEGYFTDARAQLLEAWLALTIV